MPSAGFLKFDKTRQEAYLQLLRDGTRRCAAARGVSVDPTSVRRYRREHARFAELETLAEMEACEIVEDALFQAASSGNVAAATYWLNNRRPDEWRDKVAAQVELTGPGGTALIGDPGAYIRSILDSPRAMELALDLLDEVALVGGPASE